MKIEVYLVHWQEKDIMPLVIKHHQEYADRIIILDNHSKDGSVEIAKSMGCEVIQFGTSFFDDFENLTVKNNCFQNSTADWVVISDFDEVLFSPNINVRKFLEDAKEIGHTIIKTIGWQIMSDEMPKESLTEILNGFEFSNYAKNIVFNPQAISEINFNPGSHRCDPKGDVLWSNDFLYVLHYKHIGGLERTIKRYKEYQPRMSKNNRTKGWGSHYNRTLNSLRQEWIERVLKSKPLI